MHHFKDDTHIQWKTSYSAYKWQSSHISFEVVARDNGIIMFTLPSYSSHKIQPLNRSLFSLLKTKCAMSATQVDDTVSK